MFTTALGRLRPDPIEIVDRQGAVSEFDDPHGIDPFRIPLARAIAARRFVGAAQKLRQFSRLTTIFGHPGIELVHMPLRHLHRDGVFSGRLSRGNTLFQMLAIAHRYGVNGRMAKLTNNIRRLRKDRGWTQVKLAQIMNESQQQIRRYETGEYRLNSSWIEKFAEAFAVSPLEIVAESSQPAFQEIPVIGRVACGTWKEAIEIATETIPCPVDGGPNAFALRADGDSMDKIVPDGGYVIIDPDQRTLINDRVYAVMNAGGEATLKRFLLNPPRLEPCSTNPEHSAILLGDEPFRVVGEAIWVMGRP